MDLVNGLVELQTARLASEVQFAVARKILQNEGAQASAAIELIDSASRAGAQAGDGLVAAATGLGATIDTYG